MKIYDFAPSPNARKVRGVVYELGLTPEFVNVNIFQGATKQPEFLAKNPNGLMPVLEDGDFVLWESNAIVAYLAALHPEKNLIPTSPRGRAEVDRWLFWQAGHLGAAFGKILFERVVKPLRGGATNEAEVQEGLTALEKCNEVLDACLKDKEFVAGSLSVADFALLAPFSARDVGGIDVSSHTNVQAWLERMESRESWRRVMADVSAFSGALPR